MEGMEGAQFEAYFAEGAHRGHGGAWIWCGGVSEGHGGCAERCMEGCLEGCMEGCTDGWLPLATINLVGDNREFEV